MLTESEILVKNIQAMSPIYFQPKFIEDSLIVDIEENYSSKDYNSEPYDSKQNEIIQGIKNLWQVKKEKNTFFEIICIIEKLLLNIILNPGNERYYKIKKTSRTIQTLIINIPEDNYLFQMIGFKLDDNNEFYSIDKNIDGSNQLDDSKNLELNENNDNKEKEEINIHKDFNKKYDEESLYIEREINFYDFDEALLRYRPLEVENIVKLLLDIKEALILTSSDQPIEQIINYSYTEDVFRNFKNKEGKTICQSNIGNLQMQLMKWPQKQVAYWFH